MHEYREATENDFGEICSLVKNRKEMSLIFPNGKYPFSVAQLKELSRNRKELTVVVGDHGIIGFANIYNHKEKEYAFIGNLIIEDKYRGKGLGKELTSYMLKQAFGKYELPEVRISVFSDNIPALLLYTDFGFLPYAIEERKNYEGRRVALIHMKIINKKRR